MEKLLEGDEDVDHYSAYVGGGAIRFYLPLDVQLDNDFIAQLVVVAKDLDARDRVKAKLDRAFEQGFDDVTVRVSRLELGPPVGWPVQYRVSGNTPEEARRLAEDVANALRQSGVTKR